ncbi:MAG: hypothetical protein BSR46_04895 [Candidatus Dactylopiibacterium carminicum]|nr:MAG: hypothetical protein BSR46_04895 [Candidatus Dactylopiibacterium carminicum]
METAPERRRMYIEAPIRVRSYDTDYMKVVSNTVHVKWFEYLRMEILDRYFPLAEMMKENNTPILAKTNIVYKKPLTLQNSPMGCAWVESLEKSRWVVRFEIVEDGVVYCEGRQVGYYFNLDRMRPVRFPESVLQRFGEMSGIDREAPAD